MKKTGGYFELRDNANRALESPYGSFDDKLNQAISEINYMCKDVVPDHLLSQVELT